MRRRSQPGPGSLSRTAYEWVNPAAYGLVVVTSSEGRNLPYGRLEDILSRDSSALNCHTNDDKNAWFAVDLGLWVLPSAYTLRHARYRPRGSSCARGRRVS